MRYAITEFAPSVPLPFGIVQAASLHRRRPAAGAILPNPYRWEPALWNERGDATAAAKILLKVPPELRTLTLPSACWGNVPPFFDADRDDPAAWEEETARRLARIAAGERDDRYRVEYLLPAVAQLRRDVPRLSYVFIDCEATFRKGGNYALLPGDATEETIPGSGVTRADARAERVYARAAAIAGLINDVVDVPRLDAESEPIETIQREVVTVIRAAWPEANVLNFLDSALGENTPWGWKTYWSTDGGSAPPIYSSKASAINDNIAWVNRLAHSGLTIPIIPHVGLEGQTEETLAELLTRLRLSQFGKSGSPLWIFNGQPAPYSPAGDAAWRDAERATFDVISREWCAA